MNTNTRQHLLNLVATIQDSALRQSCGAVTDHPAFFQAPAATKRHHAYPGGLAAHTLEVMGNCHLTCDGFLRPHIAQYPAAQTPDRDVLLTAALWHDFMKIREYSGHPADATYRRHTGHIVGSAMAFAHVASELDAHWTKIDAVVHCILAHHGRPEWGSPVEPQTLEAMLLHHADMWSARYGPTKDGPDGGRTCTTCGATKVDKDTCLVCKNAELYTEQIPHN